MIRTLLLAIFVVSVSCVTDDEWESYKIKHSKVYSSPSEATSRHQIFEANVQRINQHNLEHKQGIHSYTMGINQFTDMTEEEIQERYSMKLPPKDSPPARETFKYNCGSIPSYKNWAENEGTGPVRDQGNCNSCWACSTADCLATRYKIAKGTSKVVPLSAQQLVNCAKGNPTDPGVKCSEGWWPVWAMEFIIKNQSMISEAKKKYTSGNGYAEYCYKDFYPPKVPSDASMRSSSCVASGDDNALTCALTQGPLIVTCPIDQAFSSYDGGLYSPRNCDKHKPDHAVLLVGFGYDPKGTKYWIIKNSWGTTWGEGGYAKFDATETNICGISTRACYPIV